MCKCLKTFVLRCFLFAAFPFTIHELCVPIPTNTCMVRTITDLALVYLQNEQRHCTFCWYGLVGARSLSTALFFSSCRLHAFLGWRFNCALLNERSYGFCADTLHHTNTVACGLDRIVANANASESMYARTYCAAVYLLYVCWSHVGCPIRNDDRSPFRSVVVPKYKKRLV